MYCSTCHKEVDSFANNKRCRECYNSYMSEYMLRRYHEKRADILGRLGGECVWCGSKENLEVDHIDPKNKSFTISKLWSMSEATVRKEVDKCQLLCYNCHREKSGGDISNWMKSSGQRECSCGKFFDSHSKYSGHKAHCKT